MRCFNKYICRYNSQILWCNLYIHKPSRPIQWQFFHLQSWVNGNQPLDWLGDIWFWAGYKIVLCKNKQTNKKINTPQQGSKHDIMTDKRKRQPSTGQKKENIGRFKLFLHSGISNAHKFLCMCNATCIRITCTVTNLGRPV